MNNQEYEKMRKAVDTILEKWGDKIEELAPTEYCKGFVLAAIKEYKEEKDRGKEFEELYQQLDKDTILNDVQEYIAWGQSMTDHFKHPEK